MSNAEEYHYELIKAPLSAAVVPLIAQTNIDHIKNELDVKSEIL